MKNLYILFFISISFSLSAQVEGTWKLAPMAGALAVGPTQGDGSWWANSLAEVTTRGCLFDDSIKFDASGNITHYMDGSTWLETWQGAASDACGPPVSPHDGAGAFTYTSTASQLTVNGVGAHIGLPKAINGSEISDPANAASTITYEIMMSSAGDTMTADIEISGGWWRFIYHKISSSSPTEIIGNEANEVSFYPNPASAQIRIKADNTIDEVRVRDLTGKVILSTTNVLPNEIIDVSGLSSSVYLLEFRTDSKKVVKKLIIK